MTTSDIAELAGVSRVVLSAVLNGRAGKEVRCSEETRRRVLKIVEESGYRPHRFARAMREGRPGAMDRAADLSVRAGGAMFGSPWT